METRKIVLACFVGGLFCTGVALLIAPAYWWLGILAGLAGGYLSYEFKEVWKAVPVAFKAVLGSSEAAWDRLVLDIKKKFRNTRKWLSEPHPFIYPPAVLLFPVYWIGVYLASDITYSSSNSNEVFAGLSLLMILTLAIVGLVAVGSLPPQFFAALGAEKKKCFWECGPADETELINKGYLRVTLTYKSAYSLLGLGVLETLKFLFYTIWKGIAYAVCFCVRFGWYLFKLIHSQKRVLCAIDGTIGGVVSYLWLGQTCHSILQGILIALFGGLLGAALGLIDWEIISKRALKVESATASAN